MGACFSKLSQLCQGTSSPTHASPEDVKITIPQGERDTRNVFRAMFDFECINEDDLAFKKGDRLKVDDSSGENNWWWATNLRTGSEGYIPSNYVHKDDNSPQAQEWWFEFGRPDAEKLLLTPGNKWGTFLVRESADKATFVLSVRDKDKLDKAYVKHYRIRPMDSGSFFINSKRVFATIMDLIAHYREMTDGLCTLLTDSCPRKRPMVHFRELEVPRTAVVLSEKLGAGNFGEVFKGKLRGVIDVAVKRLKTGSMSAEAFLEEAKIMHELYHHRLVQLVAVCTEDEPILIMTELMSQGALLNFLRHDEGKTLQFNPDITNMACQIAEGMAYLESKNYIHRDLRAANILVGDNIEVKVADFGMAKMLEEDEYRPTDNTKFPVKWTAPESILQKSFSIKSDVWSFGVLLYELVTFGRVPYPGMPGQEVIQKVTKGYRMKRPEGPVYFDDEYYETMTKCWKTTPDDRPTFEYLQDFFSTYNVAIQKEYQE